jgi:hypothetical protein
MTSVAQQAPELNPPPIPSSSHVVISGVDPQGSCTSPR